MANDENSSLISDLNKQLAALSGTLNQEIKSTGLASDALKADSAQTRAMAKAQKELSNAIQQTTKNAVGFAKTLQSGNGSFQPLTDVVSITTRALGGLLGKIPFVGGALEGLTKGAGEVANMMIDTYDKVYSAFEKLSDSGVVESFDTLKTTSMAMGMSMTGASETLEKRSKELALLGGSALQGTKMFKMVANGSIEMRQDFQKLGISSQDFADFQISYINQQNLINGGKKKTTDELIAESTNYMKELDAVSKLTGESRKQIQKDREERLNEASILAGIEKFSPKMRDEFNKFLDDVKAKGGKELSQAYGLMIVRGGRVFGEASQKLQASAPEAAAMTAQFAKQLQDNAFDSSTAFDQATEAADASVKRNREVAIARSNELRNTALFTEQYKLSASRNKNIAALDKEYSQTQDQTLKDTTSQNAALAGTKRALEKSQINIEQLATSSKLITGLMDKMAEGIESVTEKFYSITGEDIPEHLKASSEARKAVSEELKYRQEIEKHKKIAADTSKSWVVRKGSEADLETLRKKLEEATKKKEQALERKRQEDIKAGIIAGGATTTTTEGAAAPTGAAATAATSTTAPSSQINYAPTVVDQPSTPGATQAGMIGGPNNPQAYAGLNIGGAYPGEAIAGGPSSAKLVEIAKQMQAAYPGGVFNAFNDKFHSKNDVHGRGLAFDFALPANAKMPSNNKSGRFFGPSREKGQGILAQLKGWGASYALDEYNNPSAGATGGHIHAQVSARTGGIFSGPDSGYLTELHGNEIVAPVGKQALNTSMLNVGGQTGSADFDTVYKQMSNKMDTLISVMHDTMKANKKQSQAKFV